MDWWSNVVPFLNHCYRRRCRCLQLHQCLTRCYHLRPDGCYRRRYRECRLFDFCCRRGALYKAKKLGGACPLGRAQLAHLNKHNVREHHNTQKKLKRYATPGHAHELTFSCYHRFNCLYDATRCSLFLFDSLSLTFGYPSAGCSAGEPVRFTKHTKLMA